MINIFLSRNSRKLAAAVIVLIVLSISALPAFSYNYPNSYPNYVPYRGCAYVSYQSTAYGKGSIILPATFQANSICLTTFDDTICNITSGTINGYFRTASGTDYTLRIQSFSVPEIRIQSGMTSTWVDLDPSGIQYTNISFVDYKDGSTINSEYFFNSNIDKAVFAMLVFLLLLHVIDIFIDIRSLNK